MNIKKIFIIILSLLFIAVIIAVGINIKTISNAVSDRFWSFIAQQLEKEEQARKESPYGGSFGKDTVVFMGDGKFSIDKVVNEKELIMYNTNGPLDVLLSNVTKYKKKKDILYVIGSEGFGIVDGKTNMCRLLITIPDEEYIDGYAIDANGEKHYKSRYIDDPHITYLSSYEEFTKNERKIFDKMKQ